MIQGWCNCTISETKNKYNMSTHPINLAVRFTLEIMVLVSASMWGWRLADNWPKYLFMIIVPIILAVIWGTFNVPGDPSRSGNAPIVTPGIVRLAIELAFFAFGSYCWYSMGFTKTGLIFTVVVVMHYIVSYDRVIWLISK